MSNKRTLPLETATRKKIDLMLNNLGWKTDEETPECNVFTERAKTEEQNAKFGGFEPDYVLYKSNSDTPIAIVEAKRKGQDIDEAVEDAEKKYARPLGVKIILAYDGAFFKSWHTEAKRELRVDGITVTQLVTERKLLRFLEEGYSISEVTPSAKYTRADLINVFKWANDLLRGEGLRDGMERFTEFANFLFLKLISELEEERKETGEERILPDEYCWDSFKDMDQLQMLNYINKVVLPFLVEKYNHSGDVFQRELRIKKPETLAQIVHKLSGMPLRDADSDVKGDAFEYFLKTSITTGNDLGEYFTPRHIVNLMIDLTEPRFGEQIYDPACGTGGFLIAAFGYIKKRIALTKDNHKTLKEKTVFGREFTDTARIAKMNMILTGDGHTNIEQTDSLANPLTSRYEVCLTNPAYGQPTEFGYLYPVPSNQGDSIFLQHILKALKEGGRAAVVVPEGLLFKKDMMKVRKYLLQHADVQAVISLPEGVFMPYTDNKTNILIFKKTASGTKSVWFYDLKADGFDLHSVYRKPVPENDIPDLLSKWGDKPDSEKSFKVDIGTIEANDYELLIKTYAPLEVALLEGGVPFSRFLTPVKEKAKIKDNQTYRQIRVQWHGKGATLRKTVKGKDIATKTQFIARENDLIISKIDAKEGALAIVPRALDGAVVSSDFPLFKIDTGQISIAYLDYLLRYGDFETVFRRPSRGTTNRKRIRPANILGVQVKLPSKTEQEAIVKTIDDQRKKITELQTEAEETRLRIKSETEQNFRLVLAPDAQANQQQSRLAA